MAYEGKPQYFYAKQAEKLHKAVQAKRGFTVREAEKILGVKGTAAALNQLHRMVEFGFVIEEWHGNYRKYYLP